MTIAVVGANSQVATELCVLLRARGYDVAPIVRNELAGAFLDEADFDVRIGDISDVEDAERVLGDADGVVVAAYVRRWTNAVPKRARALNRTLVDHSVAHSGADATVLYLSSVSAFGEEMYGADMPAGAGGYAADKQHLESALLEACREQGKTGYPLRLGVVLGPAQDRSKKLLRAFNSRESIYLRTDPAEYSDAVHTVTVAEAVDRCLTEQVEPRRYSVLNSPRWTHRDVAEHYARDHVTVHFDSPDEDGGGTRLPGVGDLLEMAGVTTRFRRFLEPLSLYLPTQMSETVRRRKQWDNVAADVKRYHEDQPLDLPIFEFDPVPGPVVPGLTDTEDLLEEPTALEAAFDDQLSASALYGQ